MVHIKRVELSHFKSFGSTIAVPLLPGFTVISGPNGSGKSNILDALLFCLGLATSKGMRAERLPDLVNHNHSQNGGTAETSVTVTFDISDLSTEDNPASQWAVTRRLRVSKGGSYSSTYYINGQPCNAEELHEQLNRLRIYPEGYNVVLQGDVTRIINMNSRERREIIDELAGVAEFDRKIEQAKKTLETVRETEDRYKIIEVELTRNLERLTNERNKAEKYQQLKVKIEEKQEWEKVLIWRSQLQQQQQLMAQITEGEKEESQLSQQLETLANQINQAREEVNQLNQQVKNLGEEEQLSVASNLATEKAKRQQKQKQLEDIHQQILLNQKLIATKEQEITEYQESLTQIGREKTLLETETIPLLISQRNQTREIIEEQREKQGEIATASEIWIEEQSDLTRKIREIESILNPQRNEQAQLRERKNQLEKKVAEQTQLLEITEQDLDSKQSSLSELVKEAIATQEEIQSYTSQLNQTEQEKTVGEDTQNRLLKEQREKQRQLDKLEATKQAQQEAQGTNVLHLITREIEGVCGLVAQLGQVEPRYQLALSIAASGRLGYIVVENDQVGAAGIELLKRNRAGRATFLPLNKIQPPRFTETVVLRYAQGYVDLAVNLIDCHPRYRPIFAFVFGSTVVFETLNDARPYLGKHRIVTLEGEILETSGAMSGGSNNNRSSLQFGVVQTDSEEIENLQQRLTEIEQILGRNESVISQKNAAIKRLSQNLSELTQQGREKLLRQEQLKTEIERLVKQKNQLNEQIITNQEELKNSDHRVELLTGEISDYQARLSVEQEALSQLEKSHTHKEWQEIQSLIKTIEVELEKREMAVRHIQEEWQKLDNNYLRFEEKILEYKQAIKATETRDSQLKDLQQELTEEIRVSNEKIGETEGVLGELVETLKFSKQQRDRAEEKLQNAIEKERRIAWQKEKLEATQQERRASLETLTVAIKVQEVQLPYPLPSIPILVGDIEENGEAIAFDNFAAQLSQLQQELNKAKKRLQAMEPVNMLALEEYSQTQARLENLSEKLTTLKAERTELLLRIENFTTLRLSAFKEAFDAVNENFQEIFANLSEGDGYLQLDDSENPFNGGLNLIAHPKGKPVQRLSSMSGGEKSLTALSFIFALQRYRPSPFYAFDEVDMFLDGSNVERLARMIKQQAIAAQFIVVSLRRPMIEASERTIGVTQARGAFTQVLGIKI